MDKIKALVTKAVRFTVPEIVAILVLSFFRAGSMLFYTGTKTAANYILHFALSCVVVGLIIALFNAFSEGIGKQFLKQQEYSFLKDPQKYFLFNCLFLMIAWIPWMILSYPAGMNWDTWVMFDEFIYDEITEHHSIFYELFMGKITWFFFIRGMHGLGLFLFVIIQYLLFVGTFSYSFSLMRRLNTPVPLIIASRVIYVFNPFITGYIGVALKDSFYGVLVFLSFLVILDLHYDKKEKPDILKYILLTASIVLACLTRKNGVYIYIALLAVYIIHNSKTKKHYMFRVSVIIGILLFYVLQFGLKYVTNPAPDDTAEMLSLPFQQTARYVRDYGDEVTPEQREIIDRILIYDTLAQRYDPAISDPVKDISITRPEYIKDYIGVWWSQFLKHPMCYVAATWEQNHYLFVPEYGNDCVSYYYSSHSFFGEGGVYQISAYPNLFHTPEPIVKYQEMGLKYNLFLSGTPVISLFWNIATTVYLVVILSAGLSKKKYANMPLTIFWMTLLFVIIGPTISGNPRYILPIVFALPMTIIYCIKPEEESV